MKLWHIFWYLFDIIKNFLLGHASTIDEDTMKDLRSSNRSETINPFHHDAFNMGRAFSKDIMFMFDSHDTEEYGSGYFINTKTGQRQRLIIK